MFDINTDNLMRNENAEGTNTNTQHNIRLFTEKFIVEHNSPVECIPVKTIVICLYHADTVNAN